MIATKKSRFSLPSISQPSFKRGPKDAPRLQVFIGPHYTGHAKLYDANVRDLSMPAITTPSPRPG